MDPAPRSHAVIGGAAVAANDLKEPTFEPSEEWIDEFKRQFTDALRFELRRYATRRTRLVASAGGNVSSTHVDDLVADAVADTLAGIVEWKPEAVSLKKHLEDTLKYRTRDQRRQAHRYRHELLDAGTSAEARATTALVEASMLQDRSGETTEDAIFAGEVYARVRELAARDSAVTRYLDAIAAGAQTRAEIMEAASLSLKSFRNVRERLGRIAEQLDHHIAAVAGPRGVRA